MPSLRDIALVGGLCTLVIYQQLQQLGLPEAHSCEQLLGRAGGTVRQERRRELSVACKIIPSQPGGPPCWISPLAFGLTGQSELTSGQGGESQVGSYALSPLFCTG